MPFSWIVLVFRGKQTFKMLHKSRWNFKVYITLAIMIFRSIFKVTWRSRRFFLDWTLSNRWSVMVWCGIINGYLIGPFFFDGNVDRHNYLELLGNHLLGLLENVDLATKQRMWLQQDGAPKHFAPIVREFLNLNFNWRWTGWGGPFEWPPCSPDLTSPDLFLWDYIKNVVFAQRPITREDLMERIRWACAAISRESLLKTVDGFEKRLRLCLQALRKVIPWLIVTLIAMVRGKRTHVNQPPETWEARGTHEKKTPQRKQTLLSPRHCFWVTLKVRTKCLFM